MECEAVKVEGDFLRIRCSDGSTMHVSAPDWEKWNGSISEGQKIRRIVKKEPDPYFGIRYYGFLPFNHPIPDDSEDDTETRKSLVFDYQ